MNCIKKVSVALLVLMLAALLAVPAFAADDSSDAQTATVETQEDSASSSIGMKAVAVGMGIVGGKAADGISRQPEMEGKIRTTLMLDLVFIETAIIYALLVVILVIFVL